MTDVVYLNGGTYTKTATSGAQYGCISNRLSPGSSEEDQYWMAPKDGTLRNFRVDSHVVPGGTATVQFYIRKNGADTTITCTLTAAIQTISDTTHTVTVAKGDKINSRIIYTNTPAALALATSLEFVPKPEGVV